jgi:hypothetical protein
MVCLKASKWCCSRSGDEAGLNAMWEYAWHDCRRPLLSWPRSCLTSPPEKDIDEFSLSFSLIETIFYSRKPISGSSGVAFPNIWRSYFGSPFRETPPFFRKADLYFRGTSFDRVLFSPYILGPCPAYSICILGS